MYCGYFKPVVGGAERLTEILSKALVRQGHSVDLYTQRVDSSSPDFEKCFGFSIFRFKIKTLLNSNFFPLFGLFNIFYVSFQIWRMFSTKINNYDVVHCQIASLQSSIIALLGRIKGVPVIVTSHTAKKHSDLGKIIEGSRTGILVASLARFSIKNWVAISKAVLKELTDAGVSIAKITTVPNGIEVNQAIPPVSMKPVTNFLYMGRLDTSAGRDIPTLLTSFSLLSREYPDVKLSLVGGGNLLFEYRKLADSMECSSQINLPGFDDPETWYLSADCFVLPSRYEGLSLALLEAMSRGLPCIANDIPPNREALEEGKAGILVPIGDEFALYNAMKKMISQPMLADKYSKSAFARVKSNYDIDLVAKKYVDLYFKSMIGTNKPKLTINLLFYIYIVNFFVF